MHVLIHFHCIVKPEVVKRVERHLQNIMAGGTAESIDILQVVCLI